jgi:hypothetical protein
MSVRAARALYALSFHVFCTPPPHQVRAISAEVEAAHAHVRAAVAAGGAAAADVQRVPHFVIASTTVATPAVIGRQLFGRANGLVV